MGRLMEFLDVNLQIGLPPARRGTKAALEGRLLLRRVCQSVGFERIALSKSRETDFTFVRLLACVHADVSLQLVRVRTRVFAELASETFFFLPRNKTGVRGYKSLYAEGIQEPGTTHSQRTLIP